MVDKAYNFYNKGEYVKAEKIYRKYLARDDSNSDATIMVGICLAHQGKFDEAIPYLKSGSELSTNDEERSIAYVNLAYSYYIKKEWKEAIENYEIAIGLSKNQKISGNFFNLASAYYELQDYVKAETTFRKSLALNSSYLPANINLGASLLHQGKYDEAIHYYQKAIELSTDDKQCSLLYENIGEIFLHREQWQKAIEIYEIVIQLNNGKKTTGNFLCLGFAHEKVKNYAEAESAYRGFLALDPANLAVNIRLGTCLAHQGRNDEAIPFFKLSIKLSTHDKERADANFRIGSAYFNLKEYAKAEDAYRESLALEPCDPYVHTLLGTCLVYMGKDDEAIQCYQKAIEVSTDDEERNVASEKLEELYAEKEKQ
jgi:tetratricopeptide (TPR) repeat protein